MLDKLTHEMFEPHIGETFVLTLDASESIDLKLVDVEEIPTGRRRRNAPEPKRRPFSIFFTAQPRLSQAMYPITHPVLGGTQEIFIVPVGEVDGGYEYEAVFT
jgi:hypothetical protein